MLRYWLKKIRIERPKRLIIEAFAGRGKIISLCHRDIMIVQVGGLPPYPSHALLFDAPQAGRTARTDVTPFRPDAF